MLLHEAPRSTDWENCSVTDWFIVFREFRLWSRSCSCWFASDNRWETQGHRRTWLVKLRKEWKKVIWSILFRYHFFSRCFSCHEAFPIVEFFVWIVNKYGFIPQTFVLEIFSLLEVLHQVLLWMQHRKWRRGYFHDSESRCRRLYYRSLRYPPDQIIITLV